MGIRIRNKKTTDVLHFSDDWEIVGEKNEAKIKGKAHIELFKHWAKVNHQIEFECDKHRRQYVYNANKDELYHRNECGINDYGISFCSPVTLDELEDGKIYSYYELVGKEQ